MKELGARSSVSRRARGSLLVAASLAALGWLVAREERAGARALVPGAPAVSQRSAGHVDIPRPPGAVDAPTQAVAARSADVAPREPEAVRASTTRDATDASALLRVQVVALEDDRPLADVRLRVSAVGESGGSWTHVDSSRGNARTSPRTDEQGRAELELEAGHDLRLEAEAPELSAGEVELPIAALAPGETRELLVELPTANDITLNGLVVAAESGEPVVGAMVRCSLPWTSFPGSGDEERGRELATLETDFEGRFRARFPSWHDAVATIDAPGRGRALLVLRPGHERREDALVVPLSAGASLVLELRDPRGSSADPVELRVETFAVDETSDEEWTIWSSSPYARWTWSAAVDAEGRARVDDLPAGCRLAVRLERGGSLLWRTREELALEPGERRELELDLGESVQVLGTLVEARSGEPLAGVPLWAIEADALEPRVLEDRLEDRVFATATTDRAGAFRLEALPGGAWWIGPAPASTWRGRTLEANRGIAPLAEPLLIEPGSGARSVTIRAWRGLHLRGRVLDAEGQPVAGAFVCATDEVGSADARTDARGRFELGPLAPGVHRIEASHDDHASALPLEADPTRAEELVLCLRAGGRVAGVLTSGGELAPRDATVSLQAWPEGARSPDWRATSELWLYADEDEAEFAFGGLLPGRYDLVVTTEAGEYAIRRRLEVQAGVAIEGLELELQRGARLVLLPTRELEGVAVQVLQDGEQVTVGWADAGDPSTITVPSGALTLRILDWDEQLVEERRITVRAGEELQVELP